MKFLSPSAQGALDYLLIIWLAMGPAALGFAGPYAVACYLLAGAYLLVVLLTDFTMGVVRVLSYRALGRLELISALVFLVSPFLVGFATANPTARTFFMSFGAALLVLWALTDWSGRVKSDMPNDKVNLEGNQV